MVSRDEKEFDKQGDALNRRIIADSYTSGEIASAVMKRWELEDSVLRITSDDLYDWLKQAVRMTRGDEEIR